MRNIHIREDNDTSTATNGDNGGNVPQVTSTRFPTKRSSKRRARKPILALVAILIVAGIAYGLFSFIGSRGAAGQIDGGKYQALFLTNGQVYFGKLATTGNDYYVLKDIFYLQTSAGETDSANPQKADDKSASDVKLIKLGSEVHGPEDSMVINRDQVLFFENLKGDGKVSASINEYTKNK